MVFLGRGHNTLTLYNDVHKHKWTDESNIDADKTHTQNKEKKEKQTKKHKNPPTMAIAETMTTKESKKARKQLSVCCSVKGN